MMLHDWYRERLARRRRETEAKLREAEAALQAARAATEEALRAAEEHRRAAEKARRAAAEESRRAATEEGCTEAETVAQLQQELDAWHAWDRRRQAAEKGEAFHEPSPTGTDSQNDA